MAFYTRNLKNYENAKIGYEIEVTVEEGETADSVRAKLKNKIGNWITEDISEIDAESN